MANEGKLTRREAIEGMLGAAVASMVPASAYAGQTKKGAAAPWPAEGPERLLAFNDNWRFHRGDSEGAEGAEFSDATWRVLDVPHDWSIEDVPGGEERAVWSEGTNPVRTGPFDMYASEGQTATGWTVGGVGWYRKSFAKPAPLSTGGKVELRFEGVYMNSDVWLNGVHLGNHPYGYTEFAYDLTPHLKDGRNTIAVRVDNTGRNSRWYSGSGIYRKVWLSVAGDLRILAHGVYVTTAEAAPEAALVNVQVTVENGGAVARRGVVRARLVDAAGAVAGEAQENVTVTPGASALATCAVRLRNPRLWSPNHPDLYRAEVVVETDGKAADSASLTIGVRTVEIDAARGLHINGEMFKLRGGCVHHDNGPLGSACIPRAEERRVEILKACGYNAIRTSHNPPSRDFLDACDRLGMMVLDEAFDCWEAAKNPQDYHLYFNDWWQRDLESMILRDRNHASVVLWSVGNEVKERAEPQGVEIGKELQAYVHKLDPSRMVTAAICAPYDHPGQTWQDMQPAFTYLDVGGYNYQWKEYANDHAKFPERVMVGTESYPGEVFQNWNAIESSSWVIGDFVWTAIDYIGESGVGRVGVQSAQGRGGGGGGLATYPWFDSYCGDIDLIGNKKAPSYFRDVVWRRSKVEMAVQRPVPKGFIERPSGWGWSDELHSWTWPGFEGTPLTVRVYTRGDQVKLLLNGKEVGSKGLTEKDALKAEFTVPYSPGELKAVAYQAGQQIDSIAFSTAGAAHKLVLTPDQPKLKASRDDLSYVMVSVIDEQGRPVPDAVVPVSFVLSGPGEIAAVGNGNPKDVASFRQPHRDTFHGRCVAVVRPMGKVGVIEVRGESPGLEGAVVRLNVASV
jgi:beta-galactosidase